MTLNLTPGPAVGPLAAALPADVGAPSLNPADAAAIHDLANQVEAGTAEADDRTAVTVRLKPRHLEYLEQRAEAHGEEVDRHLERILREFRQLDPWRQADTRPRGKHDPAGSGRR